MTKYERTLDIFNEIVEERKRQDTKFGEQNHPILDQLLIDRSPERMCEEYEIPSENRAKQKCDIHSTRGDLTYMHILVEELSEVASCGGDYDKMREELIQTAAVVVAMIESLDRNGR